MHDSYEPIDPITARNQYAGLRRRSEGFSPEDEQAALAKLATANIDKAIRDAFRAYPVPLHPAQVEYLVGLIQQAGERK
jgi:hypothetical protein